MNYIKKYKSTLNKIERETIFKILNGEYTILKLKVVEHEIEKYNYKQRIFYIGMDRRY